MVTLEGIKIYLDAELGVDILTRSNKRKYVYGRVLLSKLALDFIKREYGEPIALETIARFLNVGSHASILRYVNVNFKDIEKDEHYYLDIYDRFKDTVLLKEVITNEDAAKMYNLLLKNYIKLNLKLNDLANINILKFEGNYLNEVVNIAKNIDKDKRQLFLDRIKPLAKLTNSVRY